MARYDKVTPNVSVFRAPLGANLTLTTSTYQGTTTAPGIGPVGVSLDANGRVLVGGPNNSGIVGVLVKNMPQGALVGSAQLGAITTPHGGLAGDIVDVMTHGEIVDCVGLTAGTKYYADATTGALTTSSASGANKAIGYTVEATRLVVRCGAA